MRQLAEGTSMMQLVEGTSMKQLAVRHTLQVCWSSYIATQKVPTSGKDKSSAGGRVGHNSVKLADATSLFRPTLT